MNNNGQKRPDITVVIPAYNEEKHIGACLDAVFGSTAKNIEVIVINDGSTDNTAAIVEKYPCKLLRMERNSGTAQAKNYGIPQAKADIIFILDGNAVLEEHSLQNVMDIMNQNPELSGVNGFWCHEPLVSGLFPMFQAFDIYHRMNEQKAEGYSFYWGNGSAIKKNVFMESGGFSPGYEGAGCEDYEIIFRIPKERKFLVTSSVMIRHDFPRFFFQGIKKFVKRSALFTETILHYRSDDHFYTTGGNFLALVSPAVFLFFLSVCWAVPGVPCWISLFPMVYFLVFNCNKYGFVLEKAGPLFTGYFVFMSFVVTFLMFLGATWGTIGFFSVGARHVYGAQNEH